MSSQFVVAFDKASARVTDAQGFMHVAGCNISKETVNPYRGDEIPNWKALGLDPAHVYAIYRPGDELTKAAKTFDNLPLLDGHVEVGAVDLEDPSTKARVVGSTGQTAQFKGSYLTNDLVIWTAGAIAGVDSKEQTELSCAYRYSIDMTPGVFNGVPYDGKMRDIRGNHVALVEQGRAGHDVVVKDQMPVVLAEDIIKHREGHKDSEGNDAPWVIVSEKDGRVLWSGVSKEDAVIALRNMKGHAHDSAAKASAEKEGRTREASQHREKAIQHASASRKAPVRDEKIEMGVCQDDNPEGINQYTGGGGSKEAPRHAKTAEGAEGAAREIAEQFNNVTSSKTPGNMAAIQATRNAASRSGLVSRYGEHDMGGGKTASHSEAAKLHDKAARAHEKLGRTGVAAQHREVAAVHRSLANPQAQDSITEDSAAMEVLSQLTNIKAELKVVKDGADKEQT